MITHQSVGVILLPDEWVSFLCYNAFSETSGNSVNRYHAIWKRKLHATHSIWLDSTFTAPAAESGLSRYNTTQPGACHRAFRLNLVYRPSPVRECSYTGRLDCAHLLGSSLSPVYVWSCRIVPVVPQPGSAGQDGRDPPVLEWRPLHTRHRRWLERRRV